MRDVEEIATGALEGSADHSVLICLFGGFRLIKGGTNMSIRGGGKLEALLTKLALCDGYSAPRDWLLDALWPGVAVRRAAQSLSNLVYESRKLLGDCLDGAPPVVRVDGRYRLNLEAGVTVDVGWFERLVSLGEGYFRAGDHRRGISSFRRAAAVYRGDVTVDEGPRMVIERERLRALYLTVLARLGSYHLEMGDYQGARVLALSLLQVDACREDGHRLLMRCHVRQGERAQALRQYYLCQSILMTEFGVAPERATDDLYALVRTDPARV